MDVPAFCAALRAELHPNHFADAPAAPPPLDLLLAGRFFLGQRCGLAVARWDAGRGGREQIEAARVAARAAGAWGLIRGAPAVIVVLVGPSAEWSREAERVRADESHWNRVTVPAVVFVDPATGTVRGRLSKRLMEFFPALRAVLPVIDALAAAGTATPAGPTAAPVTSATMLAYLRATRTQIVGQRCVICNERIAAEYEARFCPGCGCSVHTVCATAAVAAGGPAGCPACGVSGPVLAGLHARWEAEATTSAAHAAAGQATADASRGLLLLMAGLGLTGASFVMCGGAGAFWVFTGLIGTGLGLMLLAVLRRR